MYDKKTNRSRGFGFVTFETDEGLHAVLSSEHEIMGKWVEIKRAEPRDMGYATYNFLVPCTINLTIRRNMGGADPIGYAYGGRNDLGRGGMSRGRGGASMGGRYEDYGAGAYNAGAYISQLTSRGGAYGYGYSEPIAYGESMGGRGGIPGGQSAYGGYGYGGGNPSSGYYGGSAGGYAGYG
jgi:hypothetical protein